MSRRTNGRIRTKTAREAFTEQYSSRRHGKSQSFSRLSDDTDIAYRSAPEYMRQLMNTSIVSNGSTGRSITRTLSASEMTPRNLGNPKYKAQEDYYDEIQLLKKELKYSKDDNSNLRARVRRLEEDNARKSREIEGLYDTNKVVFKDGDSRRTSITLPSNVTMNFKQRLFKLEMQLKQRDTELEGMKNDPRWTKGTELEIQNRALFNEIEKQKFERLNLIQNNYMAAIDEEKKNAVRKLEGEKQELKIENANLRKKLADHDEQISRHRRDDSDERDKHRKIDIPKDLRRTYENEIEQLKDDLKDIRRERDRFREKFENIKEDLDEIKRQRDQYRQKLDRMNEFDDGRYQTGRSSPTLKRSDEHLNKRSQFGTIHHSPEGPLKKDSRPTTPIRQSREQMNSRSPLLSTKSSQNWRRKNWTSDDDHRVEKFREKHAATVIQRGWRRHHHKSHKIGPNNFDRRNFKPGGIISPRGSRQNLGSKIDHSGSGSIKNRPSSANISHESAFKIVQAALRGYIKRSELDRTARIPKPQRRNSDDEDFIPTPARRYESERKQENFLNNSKQNFGHYNDKISSGHRFPTNDRESHRTSSPPTDIYRSTSPHNSVSRLNEKNMTNRFDRESSFRKNPLHSKQSLKKMAHDDDDDVSAF